MRGNWCSNRVFASYTDLVDHCCEAWNKLIERPWTIMSIVKVLLSEEARPAGRVVARLSFVAAFAPQPAAQGIRLLRVSGQNDATSAGARISTPAGSGRDPYLFAQKAASSG